MASLNFWWLDANSSKMFKATYFRFGVHVPGDVATVTWPPKNWHSH